MGDDPVTAERVATISNWSGIHTRLLSRLCRTAKAFDPEVCVSLGDPDDDGRDLDGLDGKRITGRAVDGRSIFGLGELYGVARYGDRLRLEARGPDAQEAVDALARLLECGLGCHEALALRDLLPLVTDFRDLAEGVLDSDELTENDREEIRSTIERFREGLDQVERLVLGPPPLHRT